MRYLSPLAIVAVLTVLPACGHVKPSPTAQAIQQYETYGPQFTDEQKASLSAEEKVAIYNAEVRPEDRIVCRRERVMGSHFRQERCFTQAELTDAKAGADTMLREARNSTATADN